jgi:hypothetical protein
LCPRHSNIYEETLSEQEKKEIAEEVFEQEKETLPFGTWIIKRFKSRSDGRNKSKQALLKARGYSQRYPKSKPLILRKRVREREKILIGVPIGTTIIKATPRGNRYFKHRFYGFSSNNLGTNGSLSRLDMFIDEEIREQNIDLEKLGINAEDFFLMHISRILKTRNI